MTDYLPKYFKVPAIDSETLENWHDASFGGRTIPLGSAFAERNWLFDAIPKCESRIEERMADSLWRVFRDLLSEDRNLIEPQAKIGKYRADFLMHLRTHKPSPFVGIVIECDGEEFHRGRRAYDKERDNYMRSMSYKVFRFTGSEIYREPIECAELVRKFFIEYGELMANGKNTLDQA